MHQTDHHLHFASHHRRTHPTPLGPVLERLAQQPGDREVRLQGVDMLAAVPQWYLNANLDELLRHGTTSTGGTLREVDLHLSPAGDARLRGTIGSLSITVHVEGEPGKVLFGVVFATGTMSYPAASGTATCDIAGLRLGVRANLGSAIVAASDHHRLPDDLREHLHAFKADEFSVEQFFMDLQSAKGAELDPAATTYPAGTPAAAVAWFPPALSTYLRTVAEAGGGILGYTVRLPAGDDPTSTFPPTAVRLATNQYRGSDQPHPDLDSVVYLMMTGGAAFPARLDPWWGNLVLPTDGHDSTWYGTVALSRARFLDALLPHLAPLVGPTWTLSTATNSLLPVYADQPARPFTQTAGGATIPQTQALLQARRDNATAHGCDDMDYDYTWSVTAAFVPGTRQVTVSRRLICKLDFAHWFGWRVPGTAKSTATVTYTVGIDFVVSIAGVIDGQLIVAGNFQIKSLVETGLDEHGILTDAWDETRAKVRDTLVTAGLDTGSLSDGIARSFDVHPIVFPAGNRFNLVGPVFDTGGDLLLGMSYKS